jgi:hypothetical protein
VRTAACFKRYTTCGPLCQKRCQLVAPKALVGYLAGLRVDPVHLEDLLCNIQSVCRSIHLGSVPQVDAPKLRFGWAY